MKLLLFVVSLLITLKWGDAIFGSIDDPVDLNNFLRPGFCPGPRIPTLGLFIDENGRPRPVPSPYSFKFPGHAEIPITTIAQLLNAVGENFINETVQSLTPRSGVFGQGLLDVPVACGEAALLENEDGHRHDEIIGMIRQRYEQENITDNTLSIFQSGDRSAFNRTLASMDCRVDIDWFDAGAEIIPRYYASGFCRERRCSLPDRNNFLCRADLTNPNQMRLIDALQFHCCWPPVRRNRRLVCGWRRVQIPIVCDCDCTCGNPEMIPVMMTP